MVQNLLSLQNIFKINAQVKFPLSFTRAFREQKRRQGHCSIALWWESIYRIKISSSRKVKNWFKIHMRLQLNTKIYSLLEGHFLPMPTRCCRRVLTYSWVIVLTDRMNEWQTDRQTDRQNDRTPQSHNSRVTTTNVFDGRCAKSIPDSSKSIIHFHYHHSDYSYSPMNHCLSYLAEAQKTVCKRSIAHLDCKKLVWWLMHCSTCTIR